MNLLFILKMMKPLLGDIEKKLAKAMGEQDKELGSKNIAYLIRRVKSIDSKGNEIEVCQMSYIDIEGYTAIEEDPVQEYALKALFIKDKKITSIKNGERIINYPLGKNITQGIEGIFSSVTSDKEDE